jgi:hypothetical protein
MGDIPDEARGMPANGSRRSFRKVRQPRSGLTRATRKRITPPHRGQFAQGGDLDGGRRMHRLRFAWPIGLLLLAGCVQVSNMNPFAAPNPDELIEKDLEIGTIGHVTNVENGGFVQVSGVGLVTGLDGTGGSTNGQERKMLEQELRKQKVEHTRALIESPNNALVLVTAYLPAGVRKGEAIDIEVYLPKDSRATSLKGGYLMETSLRNHELTSNLSPDAKSNQTLLGHVLAKAKGPLLVGIGNPDDQRELRRAHVWSGGASLVERPYYLVLTGKEDKRTALVTNSIVQRINRQFQDDPKKQKIAMGNRDLMLLDGVTQQLNGAFDSGRGDMARARTKDAVDLRVPYAYRYNHERFLRVARLLPMVDSQDELVHYRKRLDSLIMDPKYTLRAALRLEALGKESIPVLRRALTSEHHMVRFCAAESLTYLGFTAGVEELAKLSLTHPELRAYALIAMAGLDEAICRSKLSELLTIDDPQLRSGAFRALRLLDENDPRLNDEPVANQFFLHRLAPNSASLVLFSMHKRAEIVLFGPDIRVKVPLKVLVGGEFTLTAEEDDSRITVSRVTVRGTHRKQCTPRIDDVIRSLADLGAGYTDVIDLLRELVAQQALPCPVREVEPPAAPGVEQLNAPADKNTPG